MLGGRSGSGGGGPAREATAASVAEPAPQIDSEPPTDDIPF